MHNTTKTINFTRETTHEKHYTDALRALNVKFDKRWTSVNDFNAYEFIVTKPKGKGSVKTTRAIYDVIHGKD